MKNIALTLVLALILSIPVFADGDSPIGGGRSCDPNNPPSSGCNFVAPDDNSEKGQTKDTFQKIIYNSALAVFQLFI